MQLRHTSLSIQTFADLIIENRVYVDKTKDLHHLITSDLRACFFSRPRRFGKSLTVSTLDAIFTGKKHLFEHLAISKTDYAWPIHPVIRLDMKYAANDTLERAELGLMSMLDRIARLYGVTINRTFYADYFQELIQILHEKTGQKVVVLIDEYDKPLIDRLDNIPEAKKIQSLLKEFYGVLKSADEFIRFVFITGVSKFTKVSVFSDLNHLTDLTMDPTYAALVGMTEEELLENYAPHLEKVAMEKKWTLGHVIEEIRRWYNGYRFSKKATKVYNPWSTLSLLNTADFREHWYTTGIPKMLIDIINRDKESFSQINPADFELTQLLEYSQFDVYDIEQLQLIPLLFQTGFITLKTYEEELNGYRLGYPNFELRQAFARMILESRLQKGDDTPHITANKIRKVAGGRMDTVIEEPDCFYIIELKFGATAQDTINQIKTRRYSDKFQANGKPIYAWGIGVNNEEKRIDTWAIETVSQGL